MIMLGFQITHKSRNKVGTTIKEMGVNSDTLPRTI